MLNFNFKPFDEIFDHEIFDHELVTRRFRQSSGKMTDNKSDQSSVVYHIHRLFSVLFKTQSY